MSAVQRRRGQKADDESSNQAPSSTDDRKIAYDPEEQRRSEGNAVKPVLTLMEEVLLIGLKDEQGYLSFWNDSISYVLRGCILIELALQDKIQVASDPMRRQVSIADRKLVVTDDKLTGEVLLDETIKLMKSSEPMSISGWVDALSGETWNFSKMGYQLKQVRERLSKGLVDKGICRTEKQNFFFFDMATHPVTDFSAKHDITTRLHQLLQSSTYTGDLPATKYFPKRLPFRTLRTVALAASCYAANVLENLYTTSYDERDAAFFKVDELIADCSDYPFDSSHSSPWETSVLKELSQDTSQLKDTQMEVIAAVFKIYGQLDAVV